MQARSVVVGGNRIAYWESGAPDAPPVLLVHGLFADRGTWHDDIDPLAALGVRVLAVDLLGHGDSDKPDCTYLLDDFMAMLIGFLDALGLERAIVCGHSLGGAIAVHTAYHHPERVSRLVLVSAGGLGREVNPILRILSLRAAEHVTGAVMGRRSVQWLLRRPWVHRLFRVTPARLVNLRRIGRTLFRTDARTALFRSLRGVIGPRGQLGSFLEMEYLAAHRPTLLIWAERDSIIPVAHAHRTHLSLPGSELLVFPGGGHEPHRRNVGEFTAAVARFSLTS